MRSDRLPQVAQVGRESLQPLRGWGLVRAAFPVADEIKAQVEREPERPLKVEPERLIRVQQEAVAIGLKEFRGALAKSLRELQPLLR